MLECNIDDMLGEIYSYLMDILLSEGALDVTYTNLQMKKNRPGIKVSVLCDEDKLQAIEQVLLTETSTFGIRKYPVDRSILEREFKRHQTPLGQLTFKYGYYNGELIKVTPEYEELKVIAKELALPLISVYSKIQAYIEKELL
ncbi:LarC family nickel insertion protein [Acidaminobacter sp. JC074]|nr:LarC family nickel insertion protein [Acidaminobacter sp. JC074]